MKALSLPWRDVSYRLWRLRRLILVTAFLPLPGLLLAQLVGFGLTISGGGGFLWVLWILATVALAIWFPNGWTDNASFALTLLAMMILSPIAPLLGIDGIGGAVFAIVVLFAGWFGLTTTLPVWLDEQPLGETKTRFSSTVAVPAQDLREAVLLQPGHKSALYACGTANPKGLFEVRPSGPQSQSDRVDPDTVDGKLVARIVERDETMQVTQFFSVSEGGTASTTYERILPRKSGALYEKEEVHTHFTWFTALHFWLTDTEADHFTAAMDHMAGASPRALKLLPQDTFLTFAAQAVIDRLLSRTA